jgi:general secretion pathway protein L
VVGRRGTILPNEPELATALIGSADVRTLDATEVEAALLAGVCMPAVDLRAGRFARRRRIVIDRARIRELAMLSALVPLLTLVWAVISILKLDASTDRLNADTLRRAEAALGRPVTLETAESELAQRAGRSAGGGPLIPLTGLYQVLQPEPGVSATNISYSGDGTMSATIAGPTVDVLNRVLIGLQRNGYQVTAVPRQGSDGRAMIDMTVRGGA